MRALQSVMALFCIVISVRGHSQQFEFPQPERLVAVGDIHGDGRSLAEILAQMNLIDQNENWSGAQTTLVMVGDYLDRGQDSRRGLDLLMKIESQAQLAGGRVICLMGNHEVMVLERDLRYFHKADAKNYQDYAVPGHNDDKETVIRAFSADSKYGQWIASRPTIVKVGDTLFVHAGIEDWIQLYSLYEINSIMQRWTKFFLRKGPRPVKSEEWILGEFGPVWTRSLAEFKVSPFRFDRWLKAAGARRLIIGHTITDNALPMMYSRLYEDKLLMIDSAISSGIGGNLSAIEWTPKSGWQSHVFKRPNYGKNRRLLVFDKEDGIDYHPPTDFLEFFGGYFKFKAQK